MNPRERELAENLAAVREAIRAACKQAGRNEEDVRLIGASKTKPWTDIAVLLQAGLAEFGENYVQEALEKKEKVPGAMWHFIGTLQSNKAKFIPGNFALFHGLHSLSVAKKLDEKAREKKIIQECLVEVNIDGEASKGGVRPEDLPAFLQSLTDLKNISVAGFMCIPDPKREARKAFAGLRSLMKKSNESGWYRQKLHELSMGMSHDFTDAILEGATIVRVGTKIFGAREKQ